MNAISIIVLIFSLLGALDRILGNRFGLGREFERGFELFSAMAMTMIGLIVLAPVFGAWLSPLLNGFYEIFHIDPSIIAALLLANDMGGASLATELARDPQIGGYCALVVSSMMGCVISFTIPFATGIVNPSQHKDLFFGFLCGIITIPVGCFVSGFLCGLTLWEILLTLLPLLLICIALALGIVLAPNGCVKVFRGFGTLMKVLATIGLAIGIFTFLTGKTVFPEMDVLEEGARICVSACITLSGAFPLMYVVGKLLKRPMSALGRCFGVNATAALGFIPTLVTNATTYGMMRDMDRRGVVLNAAFTVSAAFVFGSHLGFTMGYDAAYTVPVIVGKLISGVCAVVLAAFLFKDDSKANAEKESS